jgi:hypothetical protein
MHLKEKKQKLLISLLHMEKQLMDFLKTGIVRFKKPNKLLIFGMLKDHKSNNGNKIKRK